VQLPLGRDLLNSLGSCTALAPAQRLKRHSSLEIVSKVSTLRHL